MLSMVRMQLQRLGVTGTKTKQYSPLAEATQHTPRYRSDFQGRLRAPYRLF
jgi:hypothetical protein